MTNAERLTQVKARLAQYLLAEVAILKGQSYSIGNRTLERADLRPVTREIERLTLDCQKLTRGTGIRVQRAVFRDI